MLTAYALRAGAMQNVAIDAATLPDTLMWIDLVAPTPEEEELVERLLAIDVPTREEMSEIELSSRLYTEGPASFMTAMVLSRSDSDRPELLPATFVLVRNCLVTVRYSDPLPFQGFAAQLRRPGSTFTTREDLLAGLLDSIVDRIADVLERIQEEMNDLSSRIFARNRARGDLDFEEVLRLIGTAQGKTSRVRESLVSIGRLLSFVTRPGEKADKSATRMLKVLSRDVIALGDHATYLSNNINFMLDASLGLINIEQTGIIKIFSVAAVVFLPPTLIASIYGMNFEHMPELSWLAGYPWSLGLMVLSGILPYLYFKRRGWL